MTQLEQLARLEEIATFVDDADALHTVNILKQRANDTKFRMPIIGQFSAGKSKLLNQIFTEDLLPTRQTETTAFTTIIEYGEQDQVFLQYKDGRRVEIDRFALGEINQSQLDHRELSDIVAVDQLQSDDVDSIHVYYNHPILKNGLMFIDTPGLNTVFDHHEQRTHSIIPTADLVLYVLGKGLTEADRQLIQALQATGTRIVFVRTRLDELRLHEGDTKELVMQKERQDLQELLQEDVIYFGLTNLETLLQYPEWQQLSYQFLVYLERDIIQQLANIRQETIETRMQLIRTKLREQLETRLNQWQVANEETIEKLQRHQKTLSYEMETIENKTKDQQLQVRQSFESFVRELHSEYARVLRESETAFQMALNAERDLSMIQQVALRESMNQQQQLLQQLIRWTKQQLQTYVEEAVHRFNISLGEIEVSPIEVEGFEPISLHVEVPTIEDIVETGDFIQEQGEALAQYEEELEELENRRQALEHAKQEYALQQQQYDSEITNIENQEPQYVERQSTENSDQLRVLGQVIDIGLMFVPATKIPALAKGAKALQVGRTISNSAQQVVKLPPTSKVPTDNKILTDPTMPKSNFLDMFSAEYLLGQVGKVFDGPPQLVEDEESKREAQRQIRELRRRQSENRRQEMTHLREQFELESEEKRIMREMEKSRQLAERERLEQEALQRKLREKKEEEVLNGYREQLLQEYRGAMQVVEQKLHDLVDHKIAPLNEALPLAILKPLQEQLHMQRVQLETLTEQLQQSVEEQEQYEAQLQKRIQWLTE